ncbi:MAG: hypothetical protein LQ339_008879 [Xanthoria mediterranea]|nr:MAG: hypothetical protein LQ339_008879 [Xanthoria mediterranea]
MASDTYRKVGRGGAGNYYSSQDIQQAQKQAAEDLEAQPIVVDDLRATNAKEPEYIHSGRGGAGNYSTASDAAERKRSVDMAPSTRERTVPEGGFYGRGGAGNLRGSDKGSSVDDAEIRASEVQKQAYEQTVQDVEKGLKAPEKAHLANP